MNINVDFTFDLTSVNTDSGTPELFVVTSSEFGDGEILETVPVDLFQAVEDAFEAYFVGAENGHNIVDQEGLEELRKIVEYLEEVADYARDFYADTRVVGASGYSGYKADIVAIDDLDD